MMQMQMIIKIVKNYAEGEITNFIKVWILAFASLSYCFFVSKAVAKGFFRLLAIIPTLILHLILPLSLHTIHLAGFSAFFLVWLANFKLLMLAFGLGPLSDPSISSLPKFAAFACLPIKSQLILGPRARDKGITGPYKHGLKPWWNYLAKALLICLFPKMYDYTDLIHPYLTWVLYSFHIYFGLELILAILGGLVKALFGIEVEQQFDEPYLSATLQDFWGRRWNVMVSKLFRPTVYDPVLNLSTHVTGRRWAPLPAVVTSFLVSGLMHELVIYYMGRRRPTGVFTAFFMVHGVCLAAEVAAKKGGWRWPPKVMTWLLTMGFLMVTSFGLFYPELSRCEVINKAFGEYATLREFVKDVSYALAFKSTHSNNTIV